MGRHMQDHGAVYHIGLVMMAFYGSDVTAEVRLWFVSLGQGPCEPSDTLT